MSIFGWHVNHCCPLQYKKMLDDKNNNRNIILLNLMYIFSNIIAVIRNISKGSLIMTIYYIKVSGIASGNKLIKTIRYPHM